MELSWCVFIYTTSGWPWNTARVNVTLHLRGISFARPSAATVRVLCTPHWPLQPTNKCWHLIFDPCAVRKVTFCTARKWHHFVKAFKEGKRNQQRPTPTSQSRCYCKRHSETKHKPAFRLRSLLSFLPHRAVMWQCRISRFIEHPRTPRPTQILFISLRLHSITADTWKDQFDRPATFFWCGGWIVGQ